MTVSQYVDGGKADISFIQLVSSNTFVASHVVPFSFGPLGPRRKTLVAVHAFGASVPLLSSSSIGGVPGAVLNTGNEANTALHMIGAEGVPGTSGNVSFTLSNPASCRVSLWSMTRANSLTPIDTALLAFPSTGSTPQNVAIDVRNGGALWAAVSDSGDNPAFVSGVANSNYATASEAGGCENITATQANRTIQVGKTSGSNWYGIIGALSFR